MSYILDALKKSEQERIRGVAPTLHSIHAVPFRQPRLTGWHYVLISAALAASAVAMWQRPWQTEKNSVRDAEQPRLTFVAVPPSSRPVSQAAAVAASQPLVESRQEKPASAPPPPARQSEQPPAAEPATIESRPARPLPVAAAAPISPQEVTPPKPQLEPVARARIRQEIIDIGELPATVQRSLPKLAISGYVTNPDDPAVKMVGIGSQILGEGDEVSPGLKLEKIADTTAVFAYKGYRFRVYLP